MSPLVPKMKTGALRQAVRGRQPTGRQKRGGNEDGTEKKNLLDRSWKKGERKNLGVICVLVHHPYSQE